MSTLNNNLVSYWTLDESSGNASDSVGGNTLTNNNTATYSAGKIKNSIHLASASSQSLSIADGSQTGLDMSGDFSIQAWINATSFPDAGVCSIVSKDNVSVSRSYAIYTSNDGKIHGIIFGGGGNGQRSFVTNSSQVSTSTIYHIVVTYSLSGNTFLCYVNGSSVAITMADTGVTSITNSTAPFEIGCRQESSSDAKFWNGWIDEVAVWSRVLTSGEVSSLYNGGSGYQYPFGGGIGIFAFF